MAHHLGSAVLVNANDLHRPTSLGDSGHQYRPRAAAWAWRAAAGQKAISIELFVSTSREAMMNNFFRPGDTCQSSGVYEVIHDGHESRHRELTVVRGEPFPPCRQCLSVQYRLARAATHVAQGASIDQARMTVGLFS